jgi:hypothetical protein
MKGILQERAPADSDRAGQSFESLIAAPDTAGTQLHTAVSARADDDPLKPERIELHAYTISTTPGLDCPYRACVARLYPTEADARKAVCNYMLEQIYRTFDQHESALAAAAFLKPIAAFPRYYVSRLDGFFQGRDYHLAPCQLEDPYRRLAWGDADDPAWRTVRSNQDRHQIAGALLPIGLSDFEDGVPPSATASLFLFRSGFGDLKVTQVATIRGSIPV